MIDEHAHKRIDAVESTLKIHSEHINTLKETNEEQTRELMKNTQITQEVANNTAELVELVKGLKGLSRLIVWLGAPVAVVMAVIGYFKQ